MNGYHIIDLSSESITILERARRDVLTVYDPARHIQTQYEARKVVMEVPRLVIDVDHDSFASLCADFVVQKAPYLRIARPNERDDNIGYHRDTWYGAQETFEMNVWLPLVDTDEDSALRVLPGSHLQGDDAYPWERHETDVRRGSEKHELGFLYAPKRLKTAVEMTPVPVRLGQAIVFHASLLHGQEINRGALRISMDTRICPESVADPRRFEMKVVA